MGTWWCDQFLPFGCRTSPAIFDLFASALEWILQTQRGWEHDKLESKEKDLAKQKRRIKSTTTTAIEKRKRQSTFNVELTPERDS
jgi:hypothetical protein